MIAQIDKHYISQRASKLVPRLLSYALFEGRPVTTKGQWINPLISVQFDLIKKLPQVKKVEKPVFIVGTGRSGTTILGVVLSMHRDVGYLNEPKALWHAIYPDEDVIGTYSKTEGRFYLHAGDVSNQVAENAHKLYGAYLACVASQRVVDKYPELIFRIPFVRRIFPNAKFIFLVRNGWDTCYSIKRWSQRLGENKSGKIHDWWGVDNRKWKLLVEQVILKDKAYAGLTDIVHQFKNHIDMAMLEWIVTMREGMKQIQANPGCILPVKFEEFTQQPEKILNRILNFCNLTEDQKVYNYAKTVISPVKPHPKLEIHPSLMDLMTQTAKEIGY